MIFVKPAPFRDSIIVLSCEYSTCQRRPDGRSKFSLLEKSSVLDFNVVPIKKVILRLFNNRLHEIVFVTGIVSLCDLVLMPLAGTPVESPSPSDQPVVSSADLLHGSLIIRSVAID